MEELGRDLGVRRQDQNMMEEREGRPEGLKQPRRALLGGQLRSGNPTMQSHERRLRDGPRTRWPLELVQELLERLVNDSWQLYGKVRRGDRAHINFRERL